MPPRRQDVYDFICAYKRVHDGNSPGIRDIMAGCGYATTSAVFHHLRQLEQAGMIRREYGGRRGIEVVGGEWRPPQRI